MKADARLALPALAAWIVLVAVLIPNEGGSSANLLVPARVIASVAALLALVATLAATNAATRAATRPDVVPGVVPDVLPAVLTAVALTGLLASALFLSLLVQAPSHVDVPSWERDPTGNYPWFLMWALTLREGFSSAASVLPGVGGQLIPGLSIGDTSAVSENLETAMKAVSLTHITAVSGANCVIVTASIMIIGAKMGLSRTSRVAWAVLALLLFVVLVTPEASVVRAAVMSTVVLVTLACGRPGVGLPLLSFAAIVMLIINPWWAIDFGFILSVSATAGLLVFARPLAVSLSRFMPQLPAMLISIPLAAQLACQPVIILLQPQIPAYGVVANVIAGPAAPLATVTGLVACLVLPFFAQLANVLLWVAWIPAQWIGQTATVFAGLPNPSFAWLGGPFGVVLAALTSVAVLLALLHPRKPVRRLVGAGLCVSCAIYLGSSFVGGLLFSARVPEKWIIAVCDVGQGDAIVLRDGDAIALIDTGRRPEPLASCLHNLGITHIDLLVLTHYDLDHAGGVAAVTGNVSRALVGAPREVKEEQIVKALITGGARVERGEKGDSGALGDSSWEVLWPTPNYPGMQDGNSGSITLRWQTPHATAIFLGDLGEDAQKALMIDAQIDSVDIVKVAHHGSGDQSAALYRRLQAQLGLVSVGEENGYGHPTKKALDMLSLQGTAVVRTDRDGLIVVSAVSGRLAVWSER
jgi:competence protein ComEC